MYENDFFVQNSIAVYKTDKKLIEFRDKLNPSMCDNYAELQGHDSTNGANKVYSNIGVILLDYSNGTGSNTIQVSVNIRPEDIFWIQNALLLSKPDFQLEQTKIFGYPDQNGYSQMTKINVMGADKDRNGNARRYQWCISAENGVGIAQHTQIGGTYCQSGTYQTQRKAYINLNDYDMFRLVNRTARYIQQFENAYCPAVIRQGRNAYEQMLNQKRMANNQSVY